MPILIACSPSTGSSLLRRILNRHSQIFCGPETSLLAKSAFYNEWNRVKGDYVKNNWKELVNVGWHHISGVNLLDENELTKNDIVSLLDKSEDYKSFISLYFDKLLDIENKSIWAEKTPSNAFAIDDFRILFPKAKIIHITRNPFDAIASLISRGMSVFNAICVYLLNTSRCLEHSNSNYCHVVKYDQLVLSPEDTLRKLMLFLDLNYEEGIIEPTANEKGIDYMKGWNYKETESIGKAGLNRFDKLSKEQKELVLMGVSQIVSTEDVRCKKISDIANALDYDLACASIGNNKMYFKKEVIKDKAKRLLRKSYFGVNNYPIEII